MFDKAWVAEKLGESVDEVETESEIVAVREKDRELVSDPEGEDVGSNVAEFREGDTLSDEVAVRDTVPRV